MCLTKGTVAVKKIFVMILGVFMLAGCVTSRSSMEELNEAERIAAGEQQMGELMLEAFRTKNFEQYIQFIPRGGRQEYKLETFNEQQREIQASMGEIVSWRFLGRLELEPAHRLVWAVRFKSNSLQGKELYKEALFTVVIGQVDEKFRVFLFGFI